MPNLEGGVYQILNTVTGHFYVGSTKNFEYRWKKHRGDLVGNRHKNSHLQAAWNKYGEENFIFRIIEKCSPDKMREAEQFYIDQGCHYNKSTKATGGGGILSQESREKISRSLQGNTPWNKGKKASEEAKRNQSESHKGKPPGNKGKPLSEEAKANLSLKAKEQWNRLSQEERNTLLSNLHANNRGSKRSDETRQRISEAKRKKT